VIDPERVLTGLNPEQLDAARTTRGPVIILAGAGTGKTTTITRRVAYQVTTGTFAAGAILAVAFTRKARTEMRHRLAAQGITGVNVQTIHGAAFQQLHWQAAVVPEVLGDGDKQTLMRSVLEQVAPEHAYVYRKDVITAIERAKGSGIPPSGFERAARSWPLPLDADVLARIYAEYERQKDKRGRIDFEDMQRLALDAMRSKSDHAERFRQRIRAITVDEFQDVSSLQVELIEAWLGGRDEICVVGDDYQSIYGFRGGSPAFLLDWPRRFPTAKRVTLEENYRSTPEILGFANRLVPSLGGYPKRLRPTKPGGPPPTLRELSDESDFVVSKVHELHEREGVAFEEMAVLVRVNRSTVQFEEAFARARIPYRVEEGGFLQRPAVAAAIRVLRTSSGAVLEAVEGTVVAGGVRPGETEDSQHVQDLETLIELAREYTAAHPDSDVAAFLSDLDQRFSQQDDAAEGRGVRLMTYHNAKGMEFDAVFLPRLIAGELPYRSKRAETPQDEERRLLYVGITRARQHLFVTRSGAPSAFWRELLPPRPMAAKVPSRIAARTSSAPMTTPNAYNGVDLTGSLLDVLKRWRDLLYRRPQFTLFSEGDLQAIAAAAPKTKDDLRIALGSSDKADKYALELLDLIGRKNAR